MSPGGRKRGEGSVFLGVHEIFGAQSSFGERAGKRFRLGSARGNETHSLMTVKRKFTSGRTAVLPFFLFHSLARRVALNRLSAVFCLAKCWWFFRFGDLDV